MMKRKLIPFLAMLLTVVLLLAGCAAHGKALIRAGDTTISVNVFQLYLSRMKGDLSSAGYSVNNADFWNTKISDDGTTQAQHFTNQVLEGLRQIAAAMIYYDELGLKLSKAAEQEIDDYINTLVEEIGEGSKSKLNSILAEYGANVTVLRDAAVIESKMAQLKTYLYGENASLVGDNVKERFYQDTYYRGYQMLLANYYHDHDRDSDGRTVYYGKDGKIAYDKEKGILTEELDQNGDTIYRNEKGGIAYDTENGEPKYYYEQNGDRKLAYYTKAEMEARLEVANQIAKDCHGNEALFLQYMEEFGDNVTFNEDYAPNGMYFSAGTYTTDTIFYTFSTELAKLEEGDLVVLDSSSGYYILMRAELDTGAWKKAENSRWFGTLPTLVMEHMLQKACEPYLARVTVDEALLAGVDITMVGANKHY